MNVFASTVALAFEACALGGLEAVEHLDRLPHNAMASDAEVAVLQMMDWVIMINGEDASLAECARSILTRLQWRCNCDSAKEWLTRPLLAKSFPSERGAQLHFCSDGPRTADSIGEV